MEDTITVKNTLSNLSITEGAFGLFIQSLGILEGGYGVLQSIADYGTIESSITVTAAKVTPVVPEPSTYALMGLGLVGISLVARRRAK